ncbi:hypothetical protein ACC684_28740 [Rhizobium ruizarguesonis]
MTITVNQPTKYVELADKRQREEAARIAQAAGGDSKLLVIPLEDRRRFKEDALRRAEAPLKKLTPQDVWDGTIKRVDSMRQEALVAMRETLPPSLLRLLQPADPKTTPIRSMDNSPHGAVTAIALFADERGREIRLYCGNIDGTVKIKKNGEPELVNIKPPTEETQRQPRYFATVAQRLSNGLRNTSPDLVVAFTSDINFVAKRLCQVSRQPEPTKKYTLLKDRLEAEKKPEMAPAVKAAPTALTAPKALPANQAHARSLWSNDREPSYDLTIAEQRAIRAAQMQSTPQPEPARYAYGM